MNYKFYEIGTAGEEIIASPTYTPLFWKAHANLVALIQLAGRLERAIH